jgi:chromosome segregation ATPase
MTLAQLKNLGFTIADIENAGAQSNVNTDKIFNWQDWTRIWLTPTGQQLLGQEHSQEALQSEARAIDAMHESLRTAQASEAKAIGDLQKSVEKMQEAEVKAIESMHGSVKEMKGSVDSVKSSIVQLTDTTERLAKRNEKIAFYLLLISAAILAVSLLGVLLHFI